MAGSETVFMFSGQGSQYFHMGKPLYEGNATFRRWMQQLDEIARPSIGESVIGAVYASGRGKAEPFDRALLSHPAIFMVEIALAHALMDSGVRPDLVLGVSMGSFAAAAIAGFLDVEDAMRAVVRQAMSLEQCDEPGGMTAILGSPALFDEPFVGGRSELAAVNFSTHFVISAKRTELEEIEAELKRREIGFQRLPVSYAFHSKWIDPAQAPFESYMRSVAHRQGSLPMVCCDQTTFVSELSGSYFWDVVRRPIRFPQTTSRLEQGGARRYVDVGPAGTLATFLKYGLPAGSPSTVHPILTPFGADLKNFAAVSSSLAN